MSSLLDGIKGYLTQELISKAASSLGESESGISKAAGSFLPAILGGLINKSSDTNAISSIFNMLNKDSNVGMLDNLSGLIGGGNLSQGDPKDIAGGFIGNLFGDKTGGLIDTISSIAGIKKSSSSSLLGMVGPLIMGALSKRIIGDKLNLSSFINLLKGEKSSVMSALPAGLGSVLGFANMGDSVNRATESVRSTTTEVKKSGMGWLWPLLLLALGALALWYFLGKGCNKTVDTTAVTDTIEEGIENTGEAVTDVVENTGEAISNFVKKLPSGFEIKGNMGGIEDSLIAFVEGSRIVDKTTWFNFDRLLFATGSAELDMEKSQDQLTNIFEIMKAFPKMKLKVGGYTDNVGDDAGNMKLSQARAESVVKALVAMGVDKARLAPEGYGEQHPVASNDTEEGRQQNRRIAVRVTEK